MQKLVVEIFFTLQKGLQSSFVKILFHHWDDVFKPFTVKDMLQACHGNSKAMVR